MFRETFLNPVARNKAGARIPDGKGTNTVGVRLQSSYKIDMTDNNMWLYIYPGVNACVAWFHGVPGNGNGIVVGAENHCNVDRADANGYSMPNGSYDIIKWRTVSLGCVLSLVNNDMNSEGFWQAIRCSPSRNAGGMATSVRSQTQSQYTSVRGDRLAYYPGADTDTDMLLHPSYMSGKLSELHKYMFKLTPQGDHDFKKLTLNSLEDLYDDSHDCIAINIQGTANVTSILFHAVHNQEVQYDESSPMARFHTAAPVYPAALASATAAAKKLVSAAAISRGSATRSRIPRRVNKPSGRYNRYATRTRAYTTKKRAYTTRTKKRKIPMTRKPRKKTVKRRYVRRY